ncbi:MAG: hypothetical protein ACRD3D_01065 [Terriglobia bacterium]
MDGLIVASTTDLQEEVNRVAALDGPVEKAPSPADEAVADSVQPVEADESNTSETTAPPVETKEDKPKHGVEKRIDRLTSRNKALEGQLAASQDRLSDALARLDAAAQAAPGEAAKAKPAVEKYSTYEEYVEALADWKIGQNEAQRGVRDLRAAQQAFTESVDQVYKAKVDEAKTRYSDWDTAVGGSDILIPNIATDAIKQAENAPDVVYYLASHREECDSMRSMTPHQVVMAIGRISSTLAAPERKTAKSKAPAPIRTVAARSTATNVASLDEMSYQDYKRARARGDY